MAPRPSSPVRRGAPRRRSVTLSRLVAAVTGAAVLTVTAGTAPPAHAAFATVGNGITTTDLAAPGMSPASLAAALVGTGVTVSNVTFTGAPAQAGLLHVVDPAVVSFNDGIILSSGNIADVVGPNKSDGITGDMGGAQDTDLTALIQNTQTVNPMTYDAVVLEFDFVPSQSPVYFTYTWASDEYLEWVNLFNDVFAFYVNGTNCATVPDGQTISIDTINDTVNPNLFRDNSFSAPPVNPINIESDGLSVEMICSAPVNAGVTNHMKLALADTSDQILDSVVMIKAQSLSTTPPESCNDGVDNDDDVLVDMEDDSCTSTTTPPPTGSEGIGSGSSAPPFTGNEGTPIPLDAAALGWFADPAALTTTWTVTGINGTPGTCEVSPSAAQPVGSGGQITVVTALCPNEGEYVARVDGWDIDAKSAFDYDVDFFVHNAPPAVTIDAPISGTQFDLNTEVAVSATLADPGILDTVTCEISWGDGTTSAGVLTDATTCAATYTYPTAGSYIVSVTGTDDAGDSAAGAIVVEIVDAGPPNTPPTADAGGPYAATEGSPVTLTGSATDADLDPLTTQWTLLPAGAGDPGLNCVIADAAALTTTVTCNDDATFVAVLTADDALSTTDAATTLTIDNAAPTLAVTAPTPGATVATGVAVALTADVADAGTNDVLTCSVAWGDGTSTIGLVDAGVCSASHVYTSTGTLFVQAGVTDDDGAATTALQSIVVVPPVAPPSITKLRPASGPVGTVVTVIGTGFTGATEVRFNGTPASFTVVSATKLTAVVPGGATTGPVRVTTAGGSALSLGSFTVTVPAPRISGFSPTSGPVGTVVTINGTGLYGTTSVQFKGIAATFTVVSPTQITAVVPAGAATGRITVTTPGGTATTKKNFTVV